MPLISLLIEQYDAYKFNLKIAETPDFNPTKNPQKIKSRAGLRVNTSGTPSGPCVGMGSRNFVYVVSGRAVRWGDPQVSRRGLTKGVFDSKYGQLVWSAVNKALLVKQTIAYLTRPQKRPILLRSAFSRVVESVVNGSMSVPIREPNGGSDGTRTRDPRRDRPVF